jgi:hypothetical protein
MRLTSGTVVGGKVVLDDPPLPEGTRVTILAPENEEPIHLSASERVALMERIRDADRGDVVDGEELLRELDQRE